MDNATFFTSYAAARQTRPRDGIEGGRRGTDSDRRMWWL